jgi:phosphomannomutase
MTKLTCCKAYEAQGEIGVNIDEDIVCRISRAAAQHFGAKLVVIGFGARATKPTCVEAASRGAPDAVADVLNIGLSGTG